jgi:hypothetical protein
MSDNNASDPAVTVDITAVTNAIRVRADDVVVGDYVFSTTGQPDRVIRRSRRGQRVVTITPERLWPLVCGPDDEITIARRVN